MNQTIHFNTGRTYTTEGQPITAVRIDDTRILFVDHARHIEGILYNRELNQRDVMYGYDYEYDGRMLCGDDYFKLMDIAREIREAHAQSN